MKTACWLVDIPFFRDILKPDFTNKMKQYFLASDWIYIDCGYEQDEEAFLSNCYKIWINYNLKDNVT